MITWRCSRIAVLLWGLILVAGCASPEAQQPAPLPSAPVGAPAEPTIATDEPTQGGVTMKLTSSAFAEGGMIPPKYTCDGKDVSPPLGWTDVPAKTKTLALIADDPDAPAGTWIHWVLFNLPPDLAGLPEGVPPDKMLKTGGVHGTTSFRRVGYGGPCPPGGTHRYFFKLYALDGQLPLTSGATAKDVQAAMKGHVLAEAQLMGRYKR